MIIAKTILKINPNAKFAIFGDDINNFKIEWHEETTPISKEDIKAMIPTVEQELKDAEANKETKKASGKQKLKDLGLDDDEIQALIGA